MKLKTAEAMNSRNRQDDPRSPSAGSKRPPFGVLAAFAMAASISGCTFDSKGMQALDKSAAESHSDAKSERGRDGTPASDRRISDIPRDRFLMAERAVDSRNPDLAKSDAKSQDIKKADSYVPCATASTGYFSSSISLMGSELVGGYLFKYKGEDASGNVIFDISCGGSYAAYGKALPMGVKTQIDVAADSRKILMTPNKAAAALVSITISVEMP